MVVNSIIKRRIMDFYVYYISVIYVFTYEYIHIRVTKVNGMLK